jgi:hypothetical protein
MPTDFDTSGSKQTLRTEVLLNKLSTYSERPNTGTIRFLDICVYSY